jgi:transposase
MARNKRTDQGGITNHKPGCPCPPCSSRARKAEALAGRARELDSNPLSVLQEVVYPDQEQHGPILIAPGNSKRARVGQWLAIRTAEPGLSNPDIAKRIGISPQTLNAVINSANKEGWLKFDDPLSRIEHEIVPKTIDNLNYWLDQKDKTVSLECAKGTTFKVYQASKGALETPNTVLALKIEMAEGDSARVIAGHVVGKPRELGD